ncbi:hypothetical protein [Actinomadura chokoriensis]|uniref:hypothetical protein n=1 Tax=Actinomadura chokoriensis TaxID=454156 RepID=UPI0031F97632
MGEIIRELVAEGATIFLTTQQLEEADHLADRIGVLDRGGLVAEGTPGELKSRIPGGHVSLQFADQARLEAAAEAVEGGTADHGKLTLQVPSDGGESAQVTIP